MKTTFGDASFYIALTNAHDELHSGANEVARALGGAVVTTDFVLLEVANWLSRSADRGLFVELHRQLEIDPHTTVVPADRELFARGRDLYAKRTDKEWSLTDCISFVVMRDRGLTEALTADHHFEQAGFVILLK